MKRCSSCGIEKNEDQFFRTGKQKSGKIKYRGDCKDCAKKSTSLWRKKNRSHYNNYVAMWRAKNPDRQHATEIKRNYGLSKDKYEKMLIEQNYKCGICKKMHNILEKRGRLFVDHSHSTGIVRGLLCAQCNTGLGNFDDNIDLLKKAIEYMNVALSE